MTLQLELKPETERTLRAAAAASIEIIDVDVIFIDRLIQRGLGTKTRDFKIVGACSATFENNFGDCCGNFYHLRGVGGPGDHQR